MSTLAILQARMTSTRLPGKVLAPILGRPMIAQQLERLARASRIDRLVVATSSDSSDDALCAVLDDLNVGYVRGSLDDVLSRFIMAVDRYDPAAVVRLTADCPLASPTVVDAVIGAFLERDVDYVSNTLRPTYPDGLDVEVVRPAALRWVAEHTSDPAEREHVTLGVYRRPESFSVENVAGPTDLSALRWTVDTPEDLDFVRSIYERLYPINPAFDLPDVLHLIEEDPGLSRTNRDAPRNAALDGLDTGAMHHKQTYQ